MPDPALLKDLLTWLRIPSISTGGGEPQDLERAAQFVCDRVLAAGGTCELVTVDGGSPLAVGELRAGDPRAPTVLIYGHYDVQSVGPPDAWESPPFDPQIRGDRLYARGASDDKGNFLPLLHEACALAREGALPVHVRVLVEGEEEHAGASVGAWARQDTRGADCAIVFDSGMEDAGTPAICVGLRGFVAATIEVDCQPRDLHSGTYGGSVLNALHVLHGALANVLPDACGAVREELRAGVEPPSPAELESWARLRPGAEILGEVGARPLHPQAGAEYRVRNGCEPTVEVNWIEAGGPRTIVPAKARSYVTMRLAPRQDPEQMRGVLDELLRRELPEGARMDITWALASPALFAPELPAMRIAARAIERATGMPAVFVRIGGSIPAVADLAAHGMPVIVGGFALAEDDIHAPNESFRLESIDLCQKTARELLLALGDLPRG